MEKEPLPVRKTSWIVQKLNLGRFGLCLQFCLIVLTLLESYSYLLIKRSSNFGYFSSRTEEWIFISAAVLEAFTGSFISWLGRSKKPMTLSFFLIMAAMSGFLILVFDQPPIELTDVELCGGDTIKKITENYSESNWKIYLRMTVIIMTIFLCVFAKISVWAHGITYMDDHNPSNVCWFYGVGSMRIAVRVNYQRWFGTHSLMEHWWKAQLSLSIITLIFGIIFSQFPDSLSSRPQHKTKDRSLKETMTALLKNNVFLIQVMAIAMMNAGTWGFIIYENEYVQSRFHRTMLDDWSDDRASRLVGDISRTILVIFFTAIFRTRLSGRRPDGIKASTASRVGGILALMATSIYVVFSLLNCPTTTITGVSSEGYQQPECSGNCNCQSDKYGFTPVCLVDTEETYFSPCHAGCKNYEDLSGIIILHNCTCGTGSLRAIRGDCSLADCSTLFTGYQVLYMVGLAFSAASMLLQGTVFLRAVNSSDRPVSLGTMLAITAITAHCGAHLLYLVVNDATCLSWRGTTCLLYSDKLATFVAIMSALFSGFSAILCFLAAKIKVVTT